VHAKEGEVAEMNGLIRPKQVLALLGISRSSLYRLCQSDDEAFPPRIRVTKGTVAFSAREVEAWLQAKRCGVPWDPRPALSFEADTRSDTGTARRGPTTEKRRSA
jgi:predicted DNA-binding transcriptional regulator AlpA